MARTKEVVYGIDLGTTYCSCARSQAPSMAVEAMELDDNREQSIPSVIYLETSAAGTHSAWVGRKAWQRQAADNCQQTLIEMAKRYIGLTPPQSRTWTSGSLCLDPIDASAILLAKIATSARSCDSPAPSIRAVVSHPRDFTLSRKMATALAVKTAGIDLIDTINEPEAAAYMFFEPGMEREPGNYLVFDLGGGTLDIAILEVPRHERPQVIGGYGIANLGGKDWDDAMLQLILEQARDAHGVDGIDYLQLVSRGQLVELAHLARNFKESSLGRTRHRKMVFSRLTNGEQLQTRLDISIADWERRCRPLLEKCAAAIDLSLAEAGLDDSRITRVLPVGGSVRLGSVQELLTNRFPGRIMPFQSSGGLNVELAVACGAARYASFEVGRSSPRTIFAPGHGEAALEQLVASAPRSSMAHGLNILVVREGADHLESLVPKGVPLPFTAERTFVVVDPGTTLCVELFEGPAGPLLCGVQASAILTFPQSVDSLMNDRLKISVQVGNSGRIDVSAAHLRTGEVRQIALKVGPETNRAGDLESRRARLESIEIR